MIVGIDGNDIGGFEVIVKRLGQHTKRRRNSMISMVICNDHSEGTAEAELEQKSILKFLSVIGLVGTV